MTRRQQYKYETLNAIVVREAVSAVNNLRMIAAQFPQTRRHVRKIHELLRKTLSQALSDPRSKRRVRVVLL